MDTPNYSAGNWLRICDTFTYLTFRYYLKIVTSHPSQYLQVDIVDKAVGDWRKRLRACVAAGGGQFEHRM